MGDGIEERARAAKTKTVLFVSQHHQQLTFGDTMEVTHLQASVRVHEDILHGSLEHGRRRAHRVMPVDVAVHEVVGEYQGLDSGDTLAGDGQSPSVGVVLDGLDQSVTVDGLAKGYPTEQ